MWILNWLPDFVFYGLVLLGIAGLVISTFFLRFIPPLFYYRTPVKIASIVILTIGVWFSGGIANEEKWQARVKEVEAKLAVAQAEAAEENVRIVEKIVTQRQVIREKGEEIIRYVDREIVKYDEQCIIPDEFIKAHNDAITTLTEQK
jgi:hypothetical protein